MANPRPEPRRQPAETPCIYLDGAATTPPLAEVRQAMAAVEVSAWGNPASLHPIGLKAAEVLERSRLTVAAALGAGADEVVFCSGGTEAAHLAIRGAARSLVPGRIVISAVEHPAVQAAARALESEGWTVAVWPVDRSGRLRLEALEDLLAPPTRLVSVIWGQSEVGTLQPVARIGEACRNRGIVIHSDAVQVAGHLPIDWSSLPLDLLTISGHKIRGPKGIGVLLHRLDRPLTPLLGGGGQEGGLRSGTVPVALACGLAVALEQAASRLTAHGGHDPIALTRDRLQDRLLALAGVVLLGDPVHRLPQHLCLGLHDAAGRPLDGRAVVRALGRRGVAASSGSACRSGGSGGSPILRAMGLEDGEAGCGLRLSLGAWLDEPLLDPVPSLLQAAMTEVAAAEPVSAP
ncbi:cysteine desulfurase [Synechococcus sp. RSCCF101]|uniref:cysteine desulfurase family protein n=1 Tax=Synechococcus sp. RSCCF101 TaxID=2511069 RepID=UPI001244658F|nr:cysteine desulfurase family protein [Synechococcus sp. RSCCF101]QEY31715.1 cysteine desulfurase [Synechococcus sp. RSCCF101]